MHQSAQLTPSALAVYMAFGEPQREEYGFQAYTVCGGHYFCNLKGNFSKKYRAIWTKLGGII